MPFLWLDPNGSGDWAAARLAPGPFALVPGARPPVRRFASVPPAGALARLVGCLRPGGQQCWALCSASPAVRINGAPLPTGLRLLGDRDEIRIGPGLRLYFSAERCAEVVPFEGGPHPAHCPRCHRIIEAGSLAVQCPGCLTWHHQSVAHPCWLYDTRCALCPQATALDAGLTWSPASL